VLSRSFLADKSYRGLYSVMYHCGMWGFIEVIAWCISLYSTSMRFLGIVMNGVWQNMLVIITR